jgi:dihydroxy-acid dehydratase
MALGGSTNTALHIPAIAYYADIDLTLKDFGKLAHKTPHLTSVAPAGPHHVVDLFYAGGIPAIMAELQKSDLIDSQAMTVYGKPMGEMLKEIKAGSKDTAIIRSIENPVHKTGGLAVLTGNLAPDGAIVKQAAVAEEMLKHTGPARIFDSEEAAYQAITDAKIKKGDVVVVRYYRRPLFGRQQGCSHRTHLSGSCRQRPPGSKAAAKGPLAALQEGDTIEIDIPNQSLNVRLTEEEIQNRIAALPEFKPKVSSGYLARYAKLVSSADKGAVFPK